MTQLETLASAREQFLALVDSIRPALHRYCARLTGSVIEGEDIVQDALAKAFYALSLQSDVPPLRPWLFRIAHNAAIDYLRGHGKKLTDPSDELDTTMTADEPPDPSTMRVALARFIALPLLQRSAVILKDVLGFSLDDVAATMDTTVPAVKAALVRGRGTLRAAHEEIIAADAAAKAQLDTYAALFNARDWAGVRELVAEECRLDLVSKSQRRGKAVGAYFGRYEKEAIRLQTVRLDGRLALAAFRPGAETPSYFILVEFQDGKVESIRDFRYVPYIAAEALYEPA
ncbi:MAG TPA: RNA polymerase sigma factor [Kofleriaceae bacterium]|nr:RNA polymerase sigma factor [Kofleriaceae bacterium]